MLLVVNHALGMRPEDIPPAVCSLLGFGLTSERMREMVNGRVAHLQQTGKLMEKGVYLVMTTQKQK